MSAHPEGGHYAETWRAAAAAGERPSGTAIYFLLRAGERSAWHRVDAAETWHFYAGAPLELSIAPGDGSTAATRHRLGIDLAAGERPQIVVPAGDWQAARTLGDWTLVGCTVSPGLPVRGVRAGGAGLGAGSGPRDRARGLVAAQRRRARVDGTRVDDLRQLLVGQVRLAACLRQRRELGPGGLSRQSLQARGHGEADPAAARVRPATPRSGRPRR